MVWRIDLVWGGEKSLTFSTLFFHFSDRFIPVKLCFMLKLWRESGYVDAEKMQRGTLDPLTGLRRGESIQEMLKKVKVRRVLIALPDMGFSPEIHIEQSWTSILTFTDLQLFQNYTSEKLLVFSLSVLDHCSVCFLVLQMLNLFIMF